MGGLCSVSSLCNVVGPGSVGESGQCGNLYDVGGLQRLGGLGRGEADRRDIKLCPFSLEPLWGVASQPGHNHWALSRNPLLLPVGLDHGQGLERH